MVEADQPDDEDQPAEPHHQPLLCHRCGEMLTPGKGDFYVIRIEAFADPAPPNFLDDDEDFDDIDPSYEINRLLEQMRDMSEQELMDQVFRRVTIHLCRHCYLPWIENPSG